MERKRIAIIGGGPAGLIAADVLAPHCEVDLYDQGKSVGRKFLVAGQGGFNLTNSIEGDALKAMYAPPGIMDEAIASFGPAELRAWLLERGIGTYVGTSGRVFPTKGIKPIAVLRAIRDRLVAHGVHVHQEHAFVGFDADARPIIENESGRASVEADHVFFALGGASWPVTGSTGAWSAHFASIGIGTRPFRSSNCGINVRWPAHFIAAHAGKALKNIRITAGERTVLGEATITEHGLEGNAIYPIVPVVREALEQGGDAFIHIDLKPNNTAEQLLHKLSGSTPADYPKALHLDRPQLALVKALTPKERFFTPADLVQDSKHLRVVVTGLRPIEEAISTVGGIRTEDLTPAFAFKRYPHVHAIGEMVDWDAPTGGYLLQGCFAMGHHAAQCLLRIKA
ncbi:MAG TPA: TIGR03862 family flavoprotein [Flavobacteriales bacterium]|nr:TIGR03862 family flavoprotein [Flavobacteriales bacterium]